MAGKNRSPKTILAYSTDLGQFLVWVIDNDYTVQSVADIQRSHVIDFLAALPGIGHPWETDHPENQGVRWYPVKGFRRHLIFYRDNGNELELLRLLHSSQDLVSALG